MNKEEQLARQVYTEENEELEQAIKHLQQCGSLIYSHTASIVAALCNVDKTKMLINGNMVDISHARWLFWLSCRYATGESHRKIVASTQHLCGKKFTIQSVSNGIAKMSEMIEQEPLWKKRWGYMKRIIKSFNAIVDEGGNQPIKIVVPKNVCVELKRE
jgi:hypothetical protein